MFQPISATGGTRLSGLAAGRTLRAAHANRRPSPLADAPARVAA
jgi:hypothetical protein